MTFDKRQTNIVKGVAALMLLWHHFLFYKEEYISLIPLGSHCGEEIIMQCCKLCVAIFLFVSGYGMYKSYKKYSQTTPSGNRFISDIKYIKNHLLKLLSEYWFIFVLLVPLGFVLGKNPIETYQSNPVYFICDFLGIAQLTGTPTMNGTWWFMGPIIVYYILTPLLVRFTDYSPIIALLVSFFAYFAPFNTGSVTPWLACYVIGMVFAKTNSLETIQSQINTIPKNLIFTCISGMLIVLVRVFTLNNSTIFDFVLCLPIIVISFSFLSKIKFVNSVLEFIGKYSGVIFMTHTFLRIYSCKKYIYMCKYSLIIFVVAVILSIALAVVLSKLMDITRYRKLVKKICS